jgi:hypothetical protein
LYGCENWSVTLREEHRFRVFQNRVLRTIFGPKREEVAGGWRRLHNEELHKLYAKSNIIMRIKSSKVRLARYVVRIRGEKCIPGGKRLLGRPRRRWENNIRMILRK